jgi:hypothetical protein
VCVCVCVCRMWQQIDVAEDNKKDAAAGLRFLSNVRPSGATPGRKGAPQASYKFVEALDDDGLPPVGLLVQYGDPVYCVLDAVRDHAFVARYFDKRHPRFAVSLMRPR